MKNKKNLKGISRKDFDKYTNEMWKRLKMGEEKYGCEYKTGDLAQSMLEEGVDLSNYSFMIYLKAKAFNKKVKTKTFK
jgi:hypothetical protein